MSHAIREAIAGILRAPMLTGLSAAMVGLALFVVSLFTLAAFNLHVALQEVEAQVEVVAYLREGTTPGEMEIARTELVALPEVLEVGYVSKDEALQRARRDLPDFGELFVSSETNPLPASIEVRLRDGSRTKTVVEEIANIAYLYPFVENVQYGREWVYKLFTLRRMAAFTTAVLGGAFGAVAALIIGTALRIAIFARREEIYIMRLVGARKAFIRRPFVVEGAITGLVGGGVALALTWGTYQAVKHFLFRVSWIPASWVVVVAGVSFGVLSSAVAVRRHLREV
jgi:cell division transport system permease protein